MILLCYLAGLASLLILARARSLGSFWCASVLVSVLYASTGLTSALVTDIVPRESLDLGLSRLWGVTNSGTVLGSSAIGLGMQYLGQRNAFLVAMLAPLAAIALLLQVRERTDRNANKALPAS